MRKKLLLELESKISHILTNCRATLKHAEDGHQSLIFPLNLWALVLITSHCEKFIR